MSNKATPGLEEVQEYEEYFDDQPTGIQREFTELLENAEPRDAEDKKPWDPNKIRIQTKQFSLKQVIDEIGDGTIDLAPDFQRAYVWSKRQQSRLIESILLGIPLPAFYFNAEPDGRMQVVDGVQRLSTINTFASGELTPSDVEYLEDLKQKRFAALAPIWRRRFNQTQIVVHVIDPQTPVDVKFDIFKRINTGGSPLTAQEIRHCMSKARSRDLLKRLAALDVFHEATRGALKGDIRMVDRELVLRFIAFYTLKDFKQYEHYKTLDDFLMAVTSQIDSPVEVPDSKLKEIELAFARAMENSIKVFGSHAFRKWPLGSDRHSPLNRALFESWSVALAEVDSGDLERRRESIAKAARKAMTDDPFYIISTSVATGYVKRVEKRFAVAREVVRGSP
ncbi:DUF262 domain-containing protein [Corallococcus exercitus]|uniref:DUF262 domain-containing protein n=1 Tax=Corallococcus exercitus TaxID=2316736 RepID=UPI000EA3E7E3|nr:DUF262 domain-containing protein [Corallococcus exercitus]RKG70227.1 DUF262 domain-containing protein [Corallococcus exercitus]